MARRLKLEILETADYLEKSLNSDLAPFSLSPIGHGFKDNTKPSLSRNFGMALDGFEQLKPDNRGEQHL